MTNERLKKYRYIILNENFQCKLFNEVNTYDLTNKVNKLQNFVENFLFL